MSMNMYIDRVSIGYRRDDGTISKDFEKDYKEDQFGVSNTVSISEEFCHWHGSEFIHDYICNELLGGYPDSGCGVLSVSDIKEFYNTCKGVLDHAYGLKWTDMNNSHGTIGYDLEKIWTLPMYTAEFKHDEIYKMFVEYADEHLLRMSEDYDGEYLAIVAKTALMLKRVVDRIDSDADRGEQPGGWEYRFG